MSGKGQGARGKLESSTALWLVLALVACGDHRGEVDERCRPDGSCISKDLECVQTFWGAVCEVKR